MPVDLMLQIMTSAELTEWMAFYRVKAEEAEEDNRPGGKKVWKPPDEIE